MDQGYQDFDTPYEKLSFPAQYNVDADRLAEEYSVRIAFLVAALNDINVLACDIKNAYVTADWRKKIYIIARIGSVAGSIMIMKRHYMD
jgi:hypothetical protein